MPLSHTFEAVPHTHPPIFTQLEIFNRFKLFTSASLTALSLHFPSQEAIAGVAIAQILRPPKTFPIVIIPYANSPK